MGVTKEATWIKKKSVIDMRRLNSSLGGGGVTCNEIAKAGVRMSLETR